MPFFYDRVKETFTTTGTGNITLGGAVAGFRKFNTVLSNGQTTYYAIENPADSSWETGVGTWNTGDTLTRSLSASSTGSLISWASGTKYIWIDATAASLTTVQTGTISMWATSSAPTGYLFADGSNVSRTTYAALFAVLSTSYGTGDGSTTFGLPNFCSRMPIGVGTGSGLTARALGTTYGAETAALSATNLPSLAHTHDITNGGAGTHPLLIYANGAPSGGNRADLAGGTTWCGTDSYATATGTAFKTENTNPGGASTAFSIMNPVLGMNFIIKT